METVRQWLRAIEMSHHSDLLFDNGYTSMQKVCSSLKDEELLILGVKKPEERAIILESIANINSLTSEASKQDAPFQVRETKDPKLLKVRRFLSSAVPERISLCHH
jgi:hypothetical protein